MGAETVNRGASAAARAGARVRIAGAQIGREPIARGALAAAAVGVLGLVLGADREVVALVAAATGIVSWQLTSLLHAQQRRAVSIEDHQTLLATMGPDARPPLFDGWAIAPDFGRLLLEQLGRRPRVVVECGSGASTLVIAAALRANRFGKLYSLEHDPAFADDTRSALEDRGLHEQAEVLTAPLISQTFDAGEVSWYDERAIAKVTGPIDLLVVDGPPPLSPRSRWPALEVFHPMLASHACVLLDDGRRRAERRAAIHWASSFSDLHLYWIDTVKGTWMLMRSPDARHEHGLTAAARQLRRTLHPRPQGAGRWPVRR
jgi:predicted O-methyltransferase YrrM